MSVASLIVSAFSGMLFSVCWWAIVHGDVWCKYYAPGTSLAWWHYFAPIITTLGILLVNSVSASVIDNGDDGFWGASGSSSGKRGMLFAFIAIMLSGVGMAVYVGATFFFSKEGIASMYAGQALVAGTSGLAVTGFLFKFARTHEKDDGFGF